MKKLISKLSLVVVLLFIITSMLSGTVISADASSGNKVKVLIGFAGPPSASDKAFIRAFGGEIDHIYSIVPGMAAEIPESAIFGLSKNPRIVSIEPNIEVHTLGEFDVEYSDTWGVDRIGADDVFYSGNAGAGIKIAVLDTGINYLHDDLNANYKGGYDFVNGDGDPMDDNGHGTHVAGTIAAEANGLGAIGVAPDAEIYALKVLGADGSGNFGWVIEALEWCIENGIQVTNSSLGSSVNPGSLVENAFIAANAAGIISISSAGNEGNPPGKGDSVGYPAAYSSVVAVAATDSNDNRAKFSSTGPDVEVAAPGVDIYSTYKDTYAYGDGTSMASPHVAGVAALMIKAGITGPDNIRTALQTTAIDLGDPGWDTKYGYGLVDAVAATGGTITVNQEPVVNITSPADGSTFDTGATVAFTGTATDAEDGSIGGTLVWTSDIEGEIGTGTSFSTVLSDGTHNITAQSTDSDGETGNDTISLTVGSITVPDDAVSITDPINYWTSGGRGGTAHLEINIGLTDETGTPVAGAEITINLYLGDNLYRTRASATDTSGTAAYKFPGAPSGIYSLTVVSVTSPGYTWDGLTPSNSFEK